MAKCGCAGTTCACKLEGIGGIGVTGTGTVQDPYQISLEELDITGLLSVVDGGNVDFTLTGDGTDGDPLVLSAAVAPGATVISTPTNGGTTAIDGGTRTQLFNHGGTIAGHTITLPAASTALEKEIKIVAVNAITALSVNGAVGVTVAGMPTTIPADGYFRVQLIGTVWRRVG